MLRSNYTNSCQLPNDLIVADKVPASNPVINIDKQTCSVTYLKSSNVPQPKKSYIFSIFLPSVTSPTTCTVMLTSRMTECSDLCVNMSSAHKLVQCRE